MDAEYFFPFFHVVFSEAATVQPEYKNKDMPLMPALRKQTC
jgi:hypothetical protein